MDKNTLSNYGWIVIAVLVLSVMIALATPFGSFIEQGVRATTEGLFDTSKNAVNTAFEDFGVQMGDQEFEKGYKGVNADNQQGGNTPQVKPEEITNYTDEEIANNPLIFGIGATNKNDSVIVFSEDGKTADVYKNKASADGKIKDIIKVISNNNYASSWPYEKMVDKIIIHEGITYIGNDTFVFAGAKEIILPDSLKQIESNSFSGNNITSITIPKNVTSIGSYAFNQSYSLKTVILADGTINTPNLGGAFSGVEIEEYILPNTLKTIGGSTFNLSSGDVRIPDSVTKIECGAFIDSYSTIFVSEEVIKNADIEYNAFQMVQGIIYCETQEVADFIINNTEDWALYNTPIVDASKF